MPDKKHEIPLTDEEIVIKITQEGKSELFTELYRRYIDKVRAKCYSMVRTPTAKEDLAQDIFVKAMEKLPGFRQESSFSTWLYSITFNHCISYLRANKRIKFESWVEHLDMPEEVDEQDVLEILELREHRVELLLEMLKPTDKALLIMKYKEGLRLKKIMAITGSSTESALKMQLNRAKKRLVALHEKIFARR